MLGKDIRLNVEEKNQRGKQGGRLCSGINGRGGDQGKMGGQGGKGGRRPRGSGNHGDVKGPARGAGNRGFAERR